jgi:hypothetical protein
MCDEMYGGVTLDFFKKMLVEIVPLFCLKIELFVI